ncbi:MAG: helix-turn-helix domain-containing protein [Deltaproteobacteria bacterium]
MGIKNLGYAVNNFRKALKLTQQELADSVGCSQGYIVDIEKGRVTPSVKTIEKLAVALGVSINSLLIEEKNDIIREDEVPYSISSEYLRLAQYAQQKKISAKDVADIIDFLQKVKKGETK